MYDLNDMKGLWYLLRLTWLCDLEYVGQLSG